MKQCRLPIFMGENQFLILKENVKTLSLSIVNIQHMLYVIDVQKISYSAVPHFDAFELQEVQGVTGYTTIYTIKYRD